MAKEIMEYGAKQQRPKRPGRKHALNTLARVKLEWAQECNRLKSLNNNWSK